MENLKIWNFSLRSGDTNYAGYGYYNFIGLTQPTLETVNNFIKIYFKDEEINSLNPINLFEIDFDGEDFEDCFSYNALNDLFKNSSLPDLNNQYIVYAGFCNEFAFYDEDSEEGILLTESSQPILVNR